MIAIMLQYVIGIVVVGGSYGLLPYLTPDTVQFGVRVPPQHTASPSIGGIRRTYYLLWIVIILASIVGCVIAGYTAKSPTASAVVSLPIILGIMVLNYLNYYNARRRMLRAKEMEHWYEGVSEGLVAQTEAHTKSNAPSLFWSIPAIIVALVAIAVPAIRYSQLPSEIAVHFNAAGVADRYAAKSVGSVFGPILIDVLLIVAMLIGHRFLNRFAIRLDPANPDASRRRISVLQNEGMKALWVLITFVNLGTTLALLPLWGFASTSVAALVGVSSSLIVVGVIICILWLARAAQKTRRISAGETKTGVVARDDDRYWVGGLFYVNRSDSALFVPKRFGVGLTINMGHPGAWVILLVIVALIVLPLLTVHR